MSEENIPYTGPVPDYIRNHMDKANGIIDAGGVVHWKFTCAHCGARQTFEDENALHLTGSCEECGKVTHLLASAAADVGFDAIIPSTPEAAEVLKRTRHG